METKGTRGLIPDTGVKPGSTAMGYAVILKGGASLKQVPSGQYAGSNPSYASSKTMVSTPADLKLGSEICENATLDAGLHSMRIQRGA